MNVKEMKAKARSFRPDEYWGKLIYVEYTEHDVFYYYEDHDGNYWFQTEGTIKFEAEIKQRVRERKGMVKKKNSKALSEGMCVVERLMREDLEEDLDEKTLDRNYGEAYTKLREMFIKGRLTQEEVGAAMVALDSRYENIRSRVLRKNMVEKFT